MLRRASSSFASLLLAAGLASAAQACPTPLATLESLEGNVRVADRPARLHQAIASNETIETEARSRSALRFLATGAILRIDQNTELVVGCPDDSKSSLLDLIRGAVNAFTRFPNKFLIRAPYGNAAIEGTEFLVAHRGETSELSVYDGVVRFFNARGSVTVGAGQGARATKDASPVLTLTIRPRNEVSWTLYYPPLSDAIAAPGSGAEVNFSRAVQRLAVGRLDEATFEIEALRAIALPEVRAETAALATIVAIARDDKRTALVESETAYATAPDRPHVALARAYALQANLQFADALAVLEKGAAVSHADAMLLARLSEMRLANGDIRGAQRAADAAMSAARAGGAPGRVRALTVKGFAELARLESSEAIALFDAAVRLDSADPLARFGLGLARIHAGRANDGRADIEMAALLDPTNSLFRSYLGKAFFQENSPGLAAAQFRIAKELDPNDPSPWHYEAIVKQSENRAGEALEDMKTAIAKNDNRSVYRSKFLLDRDLATRGTSQARIYRDLGFAQPALNAAFDSLEADSANYSAHRFLADAYDGLQRHEISQASEILQYQLLQPISTSPMRPQLAESDLHIADRTGPADIGFNEFTPAFQSNGVHFIGSETVGSNRTHSNEVLASATMDRASVSLARYAFSTSGTRPNNDTETSVFGGFGQFSLSPGVTVSFEHRRRATDEGDRFMGFNPDEYDPSLRHQLNTDVSRLGFRWMPTPNLTVLATYANMESRDTSRFGDETSFLAYSQIRLDSNELQGAVHYSASPFRILAGVMLAQGHGSTRTRLDDFLSNSLFLDLTRLSTAIRSYYLHSDVNVNEWTSIHLGGSWEMVDSGYQRIGRWNPKLGITLHVTPWATLRAGYLTNVARPKISAQTLEQTTIAGLNQFFDDRETSTTERYGGRLDIDASGNVTVGLETSTRFIKAPFVFVGSGVRIEKAREWNESAYLTWMPSNTIAISANPSFELIERPLNNLTPFSSRHVKTLIAPLALTHFHSISEGPAPIKLLIRSDVSLSVVRQSIERPALSSFLPDSDQFVLLDAGITLRFPRRLGAASLRMRNLTDQDFLFQELNFQTQEALSARFQRGRTIEFQILLNLDP